MEALSDVKIEKKVGRAFYSGKTPLTAALLSDFEITLFVAAAVAPSVHSHF